MHSLVGSRDAIEGRGGSASAHCGVSLISSYATGDGAVMAIDEQVHVAITRASIEQDGIERQLMAATLGVLGLRHAPLLSGVVAPSRVQYGRGLKTSSALATAFVRATATALGVGLPDHDLVDISTSVQRRCGLTSVGSLDDTWSAVAGGVVIAEGATKRLLMRQAAPAGVHVVVLVPDDAMPLAHRIDRAEAMRPHAPRIAALLERLAGGDMFGAATDAAFVQSRALGYSSAPLVTALANGAWGVTLSGKGPARAAFTDAGGRARIAAAWQAAYPRATVFCTTPASAARQAESACAS
jgi:shikimate kinase